MSAATWTAISDPEGEGGESEEDENISHDKKR